jgi:hypothetical protein
MSTESGPDDDEMILEVDRQLQGKIYVINYNGIIKYIQHDGRSAEGLVARAVEAFGIDTMHTAKKLRLRSVKNNKILLPWAIIDPGDPPFDLYWEG